MILSNKRISQAQEAKKQRKWVPRGLVGRFASPDWRTCAFSRLRRHTLQIDFAMALHPNDSQMSLVKVSLVVFCRGILPCDSFVDVSCTILSRSPFLTILIKELH